jgi:hypothetical protein
MSASTTCVRRDAGAEVHIRGTLRACGDRDLVVLLDVPVRSLEQFLVLMEPVLE